MKKKRGIQINLSNRWLYTFIALGILVVISVGVYALQAGVKPNPGHLISEMAPPSSCTANQVLQFDGTDWSCIDAGHSCDISETCSQLCTGTNCVTNLKYQALYTSNNLCGGGTGMTFSNTCSYSTTKTCCSNQAYKDCAGNCPSTCNYNPVTCTVNNVLKGYLVN
jgi:hypothetical protein